MNNGVAIAFGVIFVLVTIIGLVLFKEARTHRYWRHLVEDSDLRAIRGILDAEMDHWRTMRPPKGISSTMWAGVQAMELIGASAKRATKAAIKHRFMSHPSLGGPSAGVDARIAYLIITPGGISGNLRYRPRVP